MGSNAQFVGQKRDGGSDTAEIKCVKLHTLSTYGPDFYEPISELTSVCWVLVFIVMYLAYGFQFHASSDITFMEVGIYLGHLFAKFFSSGAGEN